MSTFIRDMWPEVVDTATAALPSEILEYQAQRLEERTKGFLKANVLRTMASSEEVLLSFELTAPTLDFTSILFKVRHRAAVEYPALIVPPEPLPSFLRPTITVEKVVKKGQPSRYPLGVAQEMMRAMDQTLDQVELVNKPNPWFATTDEEFSNKVGEVLRLPQVTSIITSLLTKSHRLTTPGSEPTETEPAQ